MNASFAPWAVLGLLVLGVAMGVAFFFYRTAGRLEKRIRALEVGLHRQSREQEARLAESAKATERELDRSRRAEDNLVEVLKGLTAASVRFDERLKALERDTPDK